MQWKKYKTLDFTTLLMHYSFQDPCNLEWAGSHKISHNTLNHQWRHERVLHPLQLLLCTPCPPFFLWKWTLMHLRYSRAGVGIMPLQTTMLSGVRFILNDKRIIFPFNVNLFTSSSSRFRKNINYNILLNY